MILYHGSNLEIDVIDLNKCRPNKDFGKGFYLTDIPEQAMRMARRVSLIYGGNPIVTFFEADLDNIDIGILTREMTYKKLTNQYSFNTQRAVTLLKKEGVIR